MAGLTQAGFNCLSVPKVRTTSCAISPALSDLNDTDFARQLVVEQWCRAVCRAPVSSAVPNWDAASYASPSARPTACWRRRPGDCQSVA